MNNGKQAPAILQRILIFKAPELNKRHQFGLYFLESPIHVFESERPTC